MRRTSRRTARRRRASGPPAHDVAIADEETGHRTAVPLRSLLPLKHLTELRVFLLLRMGASLERVTAALYVALLSQHLAECVKRTGILGIESDRLAQCRYRTIEVAALLQDRAEHEVRLGVIRTERGGRLHLLRRGGEISVLPVD